MNKITFFIILIFPLSAMSSDYSPLPFEYENFETSPLYNSFIKAYNAKSEKEALLLWNKFSEQLTDEDPEVDLDDLTDYYLREHALKEKMRLEYLIGDKASGDKTMDSLEKLQMSTAPNLRDINHICEKIGFTKPSNQTLQTGCSPARKAASGAP